MLKTLGEKLGDGRWFSAAAERNKDAIIDVLRGILPPSGVVLEIASGTGQHIVHFSRAFPGLTWQPSDPDPDLCRSVAMRVEQDRIPNVLPPVALDVSDFSWPLRNADAVLCINMLHVAPWPACTALMRGATNLLSRGGVLYLYGPYRRKGIPTAPSNEAFDTALRSQDPAWGLRDLDEVMAEAAAHGLGDAQIVEMPANNLSVVLRKRAA